MSSSCLPYESFITLDRNKGKSLDKSLETMRIPRFLRDFVRRIGFRFVVESFIGCWGVALLTFCGFVLHFNSSTIGFLFLLSVVAVAIVCGFWQATVVSLFAALCLDYFFEQPIFVLTISDPQDWIALGSFEISALVVSRLSSKEQRNAREVMRQRTGMEQLYELSRSTLLLDLHEAPGPQLVQLIHRIFSAEAVALFDANLGRLDKAGSWTPDEQELARQCYLLDAAREDAVTHTSQRVLKLGTSSIGAFVIRGDVSPLVVNALASLAAIAFERFNSFEKENRAEAARQSEQLRTVVLDSLAHAFKTPLTAIQTASSGLLELGGLDAAQSELVTLIDEESIQLNELCTRLLQTARLEAAKLSIEKDDVSVSQLIHQAMAEQAGRVTDHQLEVSISDPNLAVRGDRELLTMILVQYMDNAAKYSIPGSPIEIAARESRSEVLISVHNEGPTIRMEDRDRIFDRFYRSPDTRHAADGTGIGLSIVKKAAEAHRGHVWVISDEKEGTTFYLSLPQASRRSH
jgi:two-component system, OmpR family, sensor histidine kinase KdpD